MANVLVWGRARDLVAGDLPPGVTVTEVGSFAELRSAVEGNGATLVLADPQRLEAEREAVAAWVRAGGSQQAVLIGVPAAGEADAVVVRFPWLDDIVIAPVTAARLRLRLDRALDQIKSRRIIAQLDGALARKSQELHELNKIGVALSAERDIEKLLELILLKSREITAADAGSLYLVKRGRDEASTEDDRLSCELAQNDSVEAPFQKFEMTLSTSSIAGYVALTGESVNVADAYSPPPGSPFKISRSFDERSGYRTKSMLVVAMRDHKNEIIGVVQLINKKREARIVLRPVSLVEEVVVPFTPVDEELVRSLASQAAVAFENTQLIQDIRNLFDSFVRASVTAIESRDPTTSGHSGRVAVLTVALAEKVDSLDSGPFRDVTFDRDQIQEIRYASLLHDFGKVGVKEKVLIKGKKLYIGESQLVRQRFAYIRRTLEADHLRAKLDRITSGEGTPEALAAMDLEYERKRQELDRVLRMVGQANEPSVLEEESFRALLDLPGRTYLDLDGNPQPYLTPSEISALSIRRGSLSDKERREIESHVTHTFRFLSEIPWTGEFRRIPEIAYAHHEKLDGTGYPRRLPGSEIPIQSRMMTISDIYDALVAWDRPYKKAVPVERALRILEDEAGGGKLDRLLLDIFLQARIYERTLPKPGESELAG